MIIAQILNLLYNIVDRIYIGRIPEIGATALTGVGLCFPIITLITAFTYLFGNGGAPLCSMERGRGNDKEAEMLMGNTFVMLVGTGAVLTVTGLLFYRPMLYAFGASDVTFPYASSYIKIYLLGTLFVMITLGMNPFINSQGFGNMGMLTILIGAVLNIVLDLALVYGIRMGIKGAAIATVISQIVSGIGICIYTWMKMPELRFSLRPERIKESQSVMGEVVRYSAASSIQQSVMNFGILMIQGLVNSFGTAVMAAFAAAVKIDSFAYMPAQEFANAFSIFISQNRGAGKEKRVQKGVRSAVTVSAAFCICASVLIYFGARYLMLAFIDGSEHEIIRVGIQYLHIEGAFYCGIGILFLWYGYYRAVGRPEMSVVLTVISLGTRVLLSYTLAPIKSIGVIAIWWSIPIGWFLADVTGYVYLQYMNKKAKMCRN